MTTPTTATQPTAAPTTVGTPTIPAATSPTTPATAAPTTVPATTTPPDTSVGPDPTEPAAPGLAPCATSALTLSLGDTGAAAGNQYTPIIFTNAGTVTCTLDGHPGVSFTDDAGTQIGASAERVPGSTPTVTLHVGEQAHATMDYHDPGFFDDCHPQPATMLKVYPPDQYDALTIAFPERVCTTAIAQAEITIDVVKPGVDLP
ncbi:MAG: hypothetical protein JWN39_1454 [Ilumatobacteraceae bacterium]|nr:hypothetical protein [Ilumatobacteraceae bacterium]